MYIIIFEVVCFMTALICLLKDINLVWRSMVLFMLITCITEITGLLMTRAHHYNQWIYNIFLVFEASFTSLMFNNVLSKYINSKPAVITGFVLLLLLYVYDIFDHGFFIFNNLTATVMSVIFVIYSFYYYFLLIKDEQYVDLKRTAPFWWVNGVLFFYFGSTTSNLFYPFLKNVKIGGHNINYYVFLTITLILYGCWSYSFICRKWLTITLKS